MSATKSVAVLFARKDSIYKQMAQCDVYDIERDARNYNGGLPVVAHPPCRAWGRLRHFAKPRHDEKQLAFFAVDMVRKCGGVLEHPNASTLWEAAGLPAPGERDIHGGWSMVVNQHWWGHRAEKATLLYVCGCEPRNIPTMPISLNEPTHVIETRKKGNIRPSVSKKEREATPPDFAIWLCELASKARKAA